MTDWAFDPLIPLSYDLIVADPPWPFDLYSNKGNHKSAAKHYDIMTMPQIAALPVGGLAQRDLLTLARDYTYGDSTGPGYRPYDGTQKAQSHQRGSMGERCCAI